MRRFASLIPPGGRVLDLAAGGGRHSRLLLDMGFEVDAVDRNVESLQPLAGPHCRVHKVDLEDGQPWRFGPGWDGIIVTNYLHRPLLADLPTALAEGGVLIYETFMLGNERFGRPSSPEFLLRPSELLTAFAALSVIAFEQGEIIGRRSPAVVQRIAAVNGPVGRLPSPVLDNRNQAP